MAKGLSVIGGFRGVHTASRVKFHDHFARREGDEYVLGRPEISSYVTVPPVGVEVIHLLEQGLTVDEASRRLQSEDDAPPDVVDFVETLIAYGFVAEVDGRPTPAATRSEADDGVYFDPFHWIRREHVRWVFSPAAFVMHGAVFLFTVSLLVRFPDYFPTADDFFVYRAYGLNLLVVVLAFGVFSLIHEFGHLLAAHGLGIGARLRFDPDVLALALDTDIPDAWTLPRRQRLVIYAAGVIVTAWIFSIALVLLAFLGDRLPPTLIAWLELVLVVQLYVAAWQLRFHKQTDGYLIVADLVQAKGLIGDTRMYLGRFIPRRLSRRAHGAREQAERPPSRLVKGYAILYVAGAVFAVVVFAIYGLPFVFRTGAGAVDILTNPQGHGPARLGDAAAVVAAYLLVSGLLVRSIWHRRAKATGRVL